MYLFLFFLYGRIFPFVLQADPLLFKCHIFGKHFIHLQSHFGQLVSKIEFAEWFIVVPSIHSLAPLFIWNAGEQEAVKWNDLFLYFTFWSFF